jgi:hypothetical protein
MDSDDGTPRGVGCPIRRSRDHRSLASPPGFSQRATSFIASQCQGIHQMPFIYASHATPNGKHHPRRNRKVPPKLLSPGGTARFRQSSRHQARQTFSRRRHSAAAQRHFVRDLAPPTGVNKQIPRQEAAISRGHTTRFFTICHQRHTPPPDNRRAGQSSCRCRVVVCLRSPGSGCR